ncbi:MAG TPA: PAS domain S-box protein [Anaerolineae bacterium]|nr:PAS domain S-box protein [Anaerolineae bacterium]
MTLTKSILVVEDDPIVAEQLEEWLDALGYKVVAVVDNGQKALTAIQKQQPNLIMMDIKIRGALDGINTAKKVRENWFIPVIYLTGYTDEQTLQRAKETNPAAYLVKPFSLRILQSTIEIALHTHATEQELRRSEYRYRSLVEQTDDAIFIVSHDGTDVIECNHAACRLFGYELGGITKVTDIIPPDLQATDPPPIHLLHSGESVIRERYLQHRDGHLIPVEIHAKHLTDGRILSIVRDLTARRQTESALRQSQMRIASIMELGPNPIISIDAHGHIIAFNKGAEQTFGYQADEVVNQPIDLLIPTPFHDQHKHHIQSFLDSPIITRSMNDRNEIYGRRKDGEIFPAEAAISKLIYKDDVVLTVIIHEITERKKWQQRLEAIYTLGQELTFLHNEDDIIWRGLEIAFKTLQFQFASCGLLRHNDQIIELPYHLHNGRPVTYHQEISLNTHHNHYVLTINNGYAYYLPDTKTSSLYYSLDPDQEYASLLCIPIKIKDQVLGLLNIEHVDTDAFSPDEQQLLQALTDQIAVALENGRLHRELKSRASELIQLNSANRQIVTSLEFDEILYHTTQAAQNLCHAEGAACLLWDQDKEELVFHHVLGESADELVGYRVTADHGVAGWVVRHKQPVAVPNPQNDPRFFSDVDDMTGLTTQNLAAIPFIHRQEVLGVIEVINGKNGHFTQHDLELLQNLVRSASAAIANARLYSAEQKARKIAEWQHRRLQESQAQLVQAEKLAAVGRLTASVAHEVNNPLQSIQGFLALSMEMVTDISDKELSDDLHENLSLIYEEMQRVTHIVQNMRNFSRITSNEWTPIEIHSILNNVLQLTTQQTQKQNITVHAHWETDSLIIQGNSNNLKQVFLNLILNAIDAMPQGGDLFLQTTRAHFVGSENQFNVAKIIIKDTGIGIHPDNLDKLFEPFFTTKEKGSGLGLSVTHTIIHAHNGQISATSEVNKGTTFTILLPLL